jgi:hypothetical protein
MRVRKPAALARVRVGCACDELETTLLKRSISVFVFADCPTSGGILLTVTGVNFIFTPGTLVEVGQFALCCVVSSSYTFRYQ